MLEEIKKLQGISNDEFDNLINGYIEASSLDLKAIGVADNKVDEDDSLIHTARLTYVLSFLDVVNSEMYANSYRMQKDVLRHLTEYKEDDK